MVWRGVDEPPPRLEVWDFAPSKNCDKNVCSKIMTSQHHRCNLLRHLHYFGAMSNLKFGFNEKLSP